MAFYISYILHLFQSLGQVWWLIKLPSLLKFFAIFTMFAYLYCYMLIRVYNKQQFLQDKSKTAY